MAKKSKPKANTLTCGECKHSVYDETPLNKAFDGAYILKICPYHPNKILTSHSACSKFEKA